MKRLFAMMAIGMALLTLLVACGPSSSDGDSPNQDTPTETVERPFDLMTALIDQGIAVGLGGDASQPFFSVAGQTFMVHDEPVQVFTYDSPAAARAEASLVDATGFTVGTTSISWIAPPHFYLKETLLVLYVGSNGPAIDLLETVMGPQFAGADASTINPDSYSDAEIKAYLASMRELEHYLKSFTSGRSPEEFAIESITTVSAQLEGYMPFFLELTDDQRDYVFDTYGRDLQRSAEEVADAASIIQEDEGNEIIATALERIPAFAIASEITSTTDEPATASASYIGSLLLPEEIAALANGVGLTTQYSDMKAMAEAVDPAQVEQIASFDSLSFEMAGSSQGLALTTIQFDSEEAATNHLELVTSETPGMDNHTSKIGDTSFFAEFNEAGIGSIVVFKKGLWVVMLLTTQSADATPLVDLAGVEALARTVADRL